MGEEKYTSQFVEGLDRSYMNISSYKNESAISVEIQEIILQKIRQANALLEREDYQESERLLQQVLSIYDENLGKNNVYSASIIHLLAGLCLKTNRLDRAIALSEQAFNIRKEKLGGQNAETIESLILLATSYTAQGASFYQAKEYLAAEEAFQKAISIFREQLGERHIIDMITPLNGLALVYGAQRQIDKTIPLLEEILSIRKEQLGVRNTDTAISMNQLATVYWIYGRHKESENLFRQSLDIFTELLGERDLNTADSMALLGNSLVIKGEFQEAERLYEQALDVRIELLGENNSVVSRNMVLIGDLLVLQGRYSEAEPIFEKAIEIERSIGTSQIDLIDSISSLIASYNEQNRYEESLALYQQNVNAISEKVKELEQLQQINDVELSTILEFADIGYDLGLLAVQIDLHEDAETFLLASTGIWRQFLGEKHPLVAKGLSGIAHNYQSQNRFEEAERFFELSLSINLEYYGEGHLAMAANYANIGNFYHNRGAYKEAANSFSKAEDIFRRYFGDSHPDVALMSNSLAVSHLGQSNFELAREAFQQGLEIEEKNLGINLSVLTERQRRFYVTTVAGSTNAILSLPFLSPGEQEKQLSFDTWLNRKGRILDASAGSLQALKKNLTATDITILDK